MIPTSLSATAFSNFESCPARYVTESFHKVPNASGDPAVVGSVVHSALEDYVSDVFIEKVVTAPAGDPERHDHLQSLGALHYRNAFGMREDYLGDVESMLTRWYERTDLDSREVLHVETKKRFMLPTSAGEIPISYIFDRVDRLPDGSIEVTDYKSIRARLQPSDLEGKIQPRLYALAVAIEYPEVESVWVNFDLLRHDPIGFKFTRADNDATMDYITDLAEKIIAHDENDPEERINPDCRWCLRKLTCGSMQENVLAGTSLAMSDPFEAARRRIELKDRHEALGNALKELDEIIIGAARDADVEEFEADDLVITIGGKRTRTIDPARVAEIVPPEIMSKYSGLTVTSFDKLLKDPDLDAQTRSLLGGLIGHKTGAPSVTVRPK